MPQKHLFYLDLDRKFWTIWFFIVKLEWIMFNMLLPRSGLFIWKKYPILQPNLIDSFWSNKLTALFFQFLITALLALQRNLMQGENDHRFSLTRKMSSYIYNFFLHGVGKIAINLFSFFRNCSWKTNMFWIEFVTRNILFNSWKKISKQFFFFKILV